MKRKPIIIGNREFKFKKDAINYYKNILNSYGFGELVSVEHYNDIMSLIYYDEMYFDNHVEFKKISSKNEGGYRIVGVRIGKAQFNTKCFELMYKNGKTDFISYRLRINKPKANPFRDFCSAARNTIQEDLRNVKQRYFDKFSRNSLAPCQETKVLSEWKELVVDHRQPNTFSMIVDRFIELYRVDLKQVKYFTNRDNFFLFKDEDLVNKFKKYHSEKAVLRIIRKECNSVRAHQGRVVKFKKDLKIKNS